MSLLIDTPSWLSNEALSPGDLSSQPSVWVPQSAGARRPWLVTSVARLVFYTRAPGTKGGGGSDTPSLLARRQRPLVMLSRMSIMLVERRTLSWYTIPCSSAQNLPHVSRWDLLGAPLGSRALTCVYHGMPHNPTTASHGMPRGSH